MNDGVGNGALSNERGDGVAAVGDQLRCKIVNDGGSDVVGNGGSNVMGDGGNNGGVEEGKESSHRAD